MIQEELRRHEAYVGDLVSHMERAGRDSTQNRTALEGERVRDSIAREGETALEVEHQALYRWGNVSNESGRVLAETQERQWRARAELERGWRRIKDAFGNLSEA